VRAVLCSRFVSLPLCCAHALPPPPAPPTPLVRQIIPTGTREAFTVDVRYGKLRYVGGGAYGCVAAAEDSVTGRKVSGAGAKGGGGVIAATASDARASQVAIKKVTDVFRVSTPMCGDRGVIS
jgi:hypothetical protein